MSELFLSAFCEFITDNYYFFNQKFLPLFFLRFRDSDRRPLFYKIRHNSSYIYEISIFYNFLLFNLARSVRNSKILLKPVHPYSISWTFTQKNYYVALRKGAAFPFASLSPSMLLKKPKNLFKKFRRKHAFWLRLVRIQRKFLIYSQMSMYILHVKGANPHLKKLMKILTRFRTKRESVQILSRLRARRANLINPRILYLIFFRAQTHSYFKRKHPRRIKRKLRRRFCKANNILD